jgi:hypothetical protein
MENWERLSLAEMEAFVENNRKVRFSAKTQEVVHGMMEGVLKAQGYRRLSKGQKGIVRGITRPHLAGQAQHMSDTEAARQMQKPRSPCWGGLADDPNRELWKCRGGGKPGKPKAGFPPFPPPPGNLANPARFPLSHTRFAITTTLLLFTKPKKKEGGFPAAARSRR